MDERVDYSPRNCKFSFLVFLFLDWEFVNGWMLGELTLYGLMAGALHWAHYTIDHWRKKFSHYGLQ